MQPGGTVSRGGMALPPVRAQHSGGVLYRPPGFVRFLTSELRKLP